MTNPPMYARLWAEFLGTFWLVFGGCGSAVLAAKVLSDDPTPVNMGIGFVGVSLAFGLTVLTGAYALGHLSGGHFNPAALGQVWLFWVAPIIGALIAGVTYRFLHAEAPEKMELVDSAETPPQPAA